MPNGISRIDGVAGASGTEGGGPLPPTVPPPFPKYDLTHFKDPERREAALDENVRRYVEEDARGYGAYVDRYVEGLNRCRTPEEVRAYGRPESPRTPDTRGATPEESVRLEAGYRKMQGDLMRASSALATREFADRGIPIPGKVSVEVEGKVQVAALGRKAAATSKVDTDGMTATGLEAGYGPITAGVERNSRGHVERSFKVALPRAELKLTEHGQLDSLEIDAVSLGNGHNKAGVVVGTNGANVSLGVKAETELEFGAVKVKAEVKAKLTANLLSREAVAVAISPHNDYLDGPNKPERTFEWADVTGRNVDVLVPEPAAPAPSFTPTKHNPKKGAR